MDAECVQNHSHSSLELLRNRSPQCNDTYHCLSLHNLNTPATPITCVEVLKTIFFCKIESWFSLYWALHFLLYSCQNDLCSPLSHIYGTHIKQRRSEIITFTYFSFTHFPTYQLLHSCLHFSGRIHAQNWDCWIFIMMHIHACIFVYSFNYIVLIFYFIQIALFIANKARF